jgi:hypothetical protein
MELCEMGIQLDFPHIFNGITLNDAIHTIQKHSDTNTCSAPPAPSANTFSRKSAPPHQHPPTRHYPPPTLMDKRRSVESIRDFRSSPATATSLGLSSAALRIGFATPGSMPAPPQPHRDGTSLASFGSAVPFDFTPAAVGMSASVGTGISTALGTPFSRGQLFLLSNTHLSYPMTADTSETGAAAGGAIIRGRGGGGTMTPISNPLQYLLSQSRLQGSAAARCRDEEDEEADDEEKADRDTSVMSGLSVMSSMTPSPTPHITKHLFPPTNETAARPTQQLPPQGGGRHVVKTQLFETSGNTPFGTSDQLTPFGRELPRQAIATPGLTPIEHRSGGGRSRQARGIVTVGVDDDDEVELDDEEEDREEEGEGGHGRLFIFGKSTEKRGGEGGLLSVQEGDGGDGDQEEEEEGLTVESLRGGHHRVPHPRDEVRRRVSFGPMIEEKFEGLSLGLPLFSHFHFS